LPGANLYLPDVDEEAKGWTVGVVVARGNGHRLEVPDQIAILPNKLRVDESLIDDVFKENEAALAAAPQFEGLRTVKGRREARAAVRQQLVHASLGPSLGYGNPRASEDALVCRLESIVPMFFQIGEVITIERWSGRTKKIRGREYRTVNQVDCLESTGIFLKRGEDGEWVERDLEAERAAAEAAQKEQAELEAAARKIIRP
jgi:hypothetical protein